MFGQGLRAARTAASGAKAALDVAAARPTVGPLGPIHYDLGDNWQAGLDRLRTIGGEIPEAFDHPEAGPLDAIWGMPGKKGYGIAHIESEHGNVVDKLDKIIPDLPVVRQSANRLRLEDDMHAAGVRLEWDGNAKRWVVTAYKNDR